MNDQDYIRKAVELADGWGYSHTQPDQWVTWPQTQNFPFSMFPQVAKDALAAQLVRQLDESGRGGFYSVPGAAEVQWEHNNSDELNTSYVKGNDRTMNTLRAIVDSEVLE